MFFRSIKASNFKTVSLFLFKLNLVGAEVKMAEQNKREIPDQLKKILEQDKVTCCIYRVPPNSESRRQSHKTFMGYQYCYILDRLNDLCSTTGSKRKNGYDPEDQVSFRDV